MLILIIFHLFSISCQASPLLDPKAEYVVKKELKGTGPAIVAPDPAHSEMEIDYQSFDPNDSSGIPLMSNHTSQLIKLKKLPKEEAKSPKSELDERIELTFERLATTSRVVVPGMNQPFETKSDLGIFLMNKPLIFHGDGKVAKKIEGLEQVRGQAQQEVKDPVARNTLLTLLKEDILLKTGTAANLRFSCLDGLAKKKAGEKWKFSGEAQGVKIEYECVFEGWAEAKGKKLAVIGVYSGKQKQLRAQPNGTPGMTETESSGMVYFEPVGLESAARMETLISVEPTEEEKGRLKAKGKVIPRSRSVLKIWNHLYAY